MGLQLSRISIAVVTCVALTPLGLSACTADSVRSTQENGSTGGYRFDGRPDNLDRFAQSIRQDGDRTVWEAREHLVSGCLAGHGISYQPSPYPGGPITLVSITGYPDEQQVRTYGYGVAPVTGPPDQGVPTYSPIPDSQLETYETCQNAAAKATGDDKVSQLAQQIYEANSNLQVATQTTDAYQHAMADWSTCMQGHGMSFTSFKQAETVASAAQGTDPTPPQAALDIAVADLDCQKQVHLLELTHVEMADAVEHWLDTHQQLIQDYRHAVKDLDQRAATVLATG